MGEQGMIRFDIDKTIEAAAYLIKQKPGHRENYMRLLKLLYLADRQSLKERSTPICGDDPYAMEEGPVPSRTLDLIKSRDPSSEKWARYIETDGYDVYLKSDPGNLHLSRAEIKVLEHVADCFRSKDPWALVKWCHKNIPEYEKNWKARGRKACRRIPLEDVLSEIGRLADQSRIIGQINADAGFSRLFADHMPTNRK
jgi:uncharacterized phage-associated protein